MNLLAEIHDVPQLRTNLMFEVEVLCKHLAISLGELKRSQLLRGKTPPANSPDLSSRLDGSKQAGPEPPKEPQGFQSMGFTQDPQRPPQEDPSTTLTFPNLVRDVLVSPSIALFQIQPNLKPVVPLAVDRAIREIISAVVERSVTISCLTTKEMIAKDFAHETDEQIVRDASFYGIPAWASGLVRVLGIPHVIGGFGLIWGIPTQECPGYLGRLPPYKVSLQQKRELLETRR
jgi:hypothetical protein